MSLPQAPEIAPLGEHALLLTFAHTISRETGLHVHTVTRAIREARIDGVRDVVPAYTTVAVYFDDGVDRDSLATMLARLALQEDHAADPPSRLIEIPVRYDGIDIAEVAERTGLSKATVVERHAAPTYYVYMLGFSPGFAYLGDLDPALVLERRSEPRTRVPSGSVAIAGAQTAVYPLSTPGGWHIIGTTSTVMFDALREPPGLLQAGDAVRFVPVSS